VNNSESSGIFDLITGLPVHPLIIHVVVIMLPVAALAMVALVFLPTLRRHYLLPTLVALLVGAGSAFVAKQSGEALQNRVGSPGEHAELGENVVPLALGLFAVSVIWAYAPKIMSRWPKFLQRVLELGILVLAGASIVFTVLAGHSGATASWENRIGIDAAMPAVVDTTTTDTTTETPIPSEPVAPAPVLYSLELVAEHATAEDCWSIVGDSVYDLTDWIAAHPGGAQRIISMCGNDSTSDYENQHAGQRSATATLDRYVIGTLGEPVS